jgi:HlyD family secretion protein
VDVDEMDIASVRVGQRVFATAPAFGNQRFYGRVTHIEPTLGRKNFRTNRPTERVDSKILEAVVALDSGETVPLELQMVVWFRDASIREIAAKPQSAGM